MIHHPLWTRATFRNAGGMTELVGDSDQIGLVVDWLDAQEARLAGLLDLYAADATLECRCREGLSAGPCRTRNPLAAAS
jgi:class 3 adenylate cyclase